MMVDQLPPAAEHKASTTGLPQRGPLLFSGGGGRSRLCAGTTQHDSPSITSITEPTAYSIVNCSTGAGTNQAQRYVSDPMARDGWCLGDDSLVWRTYPYTQVGQVATVVRYDELVLDGAHEYDFLVDVSPCLSPPQEGETNEEAVTHKDHGSATSAELKTGGGAGGLAVNRGRTSLSKPPGIFMILMATFCPSFVACKRSDGIPRRGTGRGRNNGAYGCSS